jgi:dihydroorotase
MADTIIIKKPFDAHVHGRDDRILRTVGPMTARQFWGAIFEPNLVPPITTADQAKAYRERIYMATSGRQFEPFVLAYLTDDLDPHELDRGLDENAFIGAKFYPRGATTNSDNGIVDVTKLWEDGSRQFDLIRALTNHRRVCQLHCELNHTLDGKELDPYHKEAYFFREVMPRLIDAHPDARFSCEHLTSKEGAEFLLQNGGRQLGCSITPHHLLFDRRDMYRGGLCPHFFCLPVIKREEHNEALLKLIAYGRHFVYAGTDSAPHDRRKKESDCCSGGMFSAHAAIELYAQAFDELDLLGERHFEDFMSVNGPSFYDLLPSEDTVTLVREPWTVDQMIQYSENPEDVIVPIGYHTNPDKRLVLNWKLRDA